MAQTTVDPPNKIIHGTAAGFDLGCRSAGGCANHGSAEWLTCKEAAAAYRSNFALSKLPADEPIARAALEAPKPTRLEPTATTTVKAAVRTTPTSIRKDSIEVDRALVPPASAPQPINAQAFSP